MTSRKVTVGIVQCAMTDDMSVNNEKIATLIREAAKQGAQVVLTPELFQGHYFCTSQEEKNFERAYAWDKHPSVLALQKLAKELKLVLPVSIYERDHACFYNSLVMIDADGSLMGVYRKSHIPDGPGYQEKYYFRPGDTGFKVWETKYAKIGAGICWDQWFPEAARSMMLLGAELLLYPTAIGSEPYNAALDTSQRWQLAQRGHAVSNCVPVAAANRIGLEGKQAYYGSSFISDQTGKLVAEMGRDEEGVRTHTFDLDALLTERADWGFFRDRRTDLYLK